MCCMILSRVNNYQCWVTIMCSDNKKQNYSQLWLSGTWLLEIFRYILHLIWGTILDGNKYGVLLNQSWQYFPDITGRWLSLEYLFTLSFPFHLILTAQLCHSSPSGSMALHYTSFLCLGGVLDVQAHLPYCHPLLEIGRYIIHCISFTGHIYQSEQCS